jgi:hypothetical protein
MQDSYETLLTVADKTEDRYHYEYFYDTFLQIFYGMH